MGQVERSTEGGGGQITNLWKQSETRTQGRYYQKQLTCGEAWILFSRIFFGVFFCDIYIFLGGSLIVTVSCSICPPLRQRIKFWNGQYNIFKNTTYLQKRNFPPNFKNILSNHISIWRKKNWNFSCIWHFFGGVLKIKFFWGDQCMYVDPGQVDF